MLLGSAIKLKELCLTQTKPGCRCYLTGAYCIAPVVERSCNAYHMQLLSGCPPIMYWLGHYVWDMLCHTVVTVLAMAVFGVYVSLTTHALCARQPV